MHLFLCFTPQMAMLGFFILPPYAATGNRTHVCIVAPPWGTLIRDALTTELPRPLLGARLRWWVDNCELSLFLFSPPSLFWHQVENLLENIDVKIEVKREKFLELNEDFFTRVTKPIETALMTSSVTLNEISEVILMGAGTRVPRVQVCWPRIFLKYGYNEF